MTAWVLMGVTDVSISLMVTTLVSDLTALPMCIEILTGRNCFPEIAIFCNGNPTRKNNTLVGYKMTIGQVNIISSMQF